MKFNEKLRELRRKRGVSQGKLAAFLGVTFQSVSKWERGAAMPDVALLPVIAWFFGVTVDELLCTEKIDEEALYSAFERRAEELFRSGEHGEAHLEIWQEAYRKMPNNPRVREHLMAAFFDADKVKYADEISELASEFYYSDLDNYSKGQAIRLAAVSRAASGDMSGARKWASRAGLAMHSEEKILAEFDSGEELLEDVRSFVFHAFEQIFYMTVRLAQDGILSRRESLEALETAASLFELLYKNDDAGYETLNKIFNLHSLAADFSDDEDAAKLHLERACEVALKMPAVREHELKTALLKGLEVQDAPSDGLRAARFLLGKVGSGECMRWRECGWCGEIWDRLEGEVKGF